MKKAVFIIVAILSIIINFIITFPYGFDIVGAPGLVLHYTAIILGIISLFSVKGLESDKIYQKKKNILFFVINLAALSYGLLLEIVLLMR